MPRPVVFLAKSEYFTGKGLKGWATRVFFQAAGQLPIDRSGGKASEASLNTGLKVLAEGSILGIYPEGTRSPDGKLYRGRTGVARMVLESGVPVVPVAMIGTEHVMPIGTRLPKVRRIGIIIGEPIDFTRFEGMEGDRFVLRSVTDELVYRAARPQRPGVRRRLREFGQGATGLAVAIGSNGGGATCVAVPFPGARRARPSRTLPWYSSPSPSSSQIPP